jgi:hypothetical protein
MIDYMGIKQRLAEFDEKHGEQVIHDGWILFADGAVREANPLGALQEPPSDPWACAKQRVTFCSVALRQATELFENAKTSRLQMVKGALNSQFCPAPATTQAELAELKVLKKAVQERTKALAEARREAETTKPAWLKEREVESAKNRAAQEKLLESLQGM